LRTIFLGGGQGFCDDGFVPAGAAAAAEFEQSDELVFLRRRVLATGLAAPDGLGFCSDGVVEDVAGGLGDCGGDDVTGVAGD
jgi:hypothetical protein